MATLIKQVLNPIGIGALCLSAALAPAQVFAAASSSGRVVFSNVEFVDLDKDDGLSPEIAWLGKIDGLLDAEADAANHPPATDHKLVTTFKSDSVNAAIWYGTMAKSNLIAGSSFYSQIQSLGYTGPGGYYASVAQLTGLISLSAKTTVTFSGTVSASATAGPSAADYANGAAYVSLSALEQPPVDPVFCIIKNDNFCAKPFSFTITNNTSDAIAVGYDLLTSVDGFSAPVPEPGSAVLLLVGLAGLMVSRTRRNRR